MAEKSVGTENRRKEKEGRRRKGERSELRRCMMKKAGIGDKNGKGGWMNHEGDYGDKECRVRDQDEGERNRDEG